MIEIGCAFSIDKEEMLSSIVRKLSEDETIYSSTCSKSKEYVAQKTGATQHVIDYVKSNLLLTK